MVPTSSSRSVKKSTDIPLMRRSKRHAFTLIELIIVILLMMLMFYIGASMLLPSFRNKPTHVAPTNLKQALIEATGGAQGTLLCTGEPCRTCYFRPDIQSPFKKIKATIDLGTLKRFTVDAQGHLNPIQEEHYRDEPVCLRIRFDADGASTPLIVQNAKGVYWLPSFFGTVLRYETPTQAREAWLATKKQVLEEGLF